ncbi:Crp/Fnr family transcriptional regulator [Kozakia baliensis]|uniref:Crp/Fnr family transcriptional regulator n=1 Tax=Kozakia baliensis TaxID=153496 RepID=UPI00345BC0CA
MALSSNSRVIDPGIFQIRVVDSWLEAMPHDGKNLLLSDKDRQTLCDLASPVDIREANRSLYRQGDTATDVFLLVDGLVRTSRIVANGNRQIIAFHWPGDFFGLSEHNLYVSDADSVSPSFLCRFSLQALEKAFAEHPALQSLFLVKALNDLREAQHQIVNVSQSDLPSRLAFFLLECAEHPECYDAEQHIVTLPMSRLDLADYLGAAQESVSRALTVLEKRQLIRRLSTQRLWLDTVHLPPFCTLDRES